MRLAPSWIIRQSQLLASTERAAEQSVAPTFAECGHSPLEGWTPHSARQKMQLPVSSHPHRDIVLSAAAPGHIVDACEKSRPNQPRSRIDVVDICLQTTPSPASAVSPHRSREPRKSLTSN
ncbi:hypothetical protein RPD_0055 [Rhodopseudomonas palustris BisB5]|uniref:Uncharacterized protein n=1 Tax=Rhodopseudomonas palustris (strain BisB5) TaxID=316057 RepID=Q13F44_RHOPS|nr:hypothetical protein RPD_0055 [Rhodopseudomonas palustris BisB5]